MLFFVVDQHSSRPRGRDYPCAVLTIDNWDDYGFKTMYDCTIYLAPGKLIRLEHVKILKLGQQQDRTPIPSSFNELDSTFCSLGQELAYYERLMTLPDEIRQDFLRSLRDVVADESILEAFRNESGFDTSLLRFGPAARALEDAPSMLEIGAPELDELSFAFHTRFGANEFGTTFTYCQIDELPGRLNAVIGYNGCGKTQLLANLAWVARADLRGRRDDEAIHEYGRLDPPDLRFGHVLAISYSAFDTFDLPRPSTAGAAFGYTYCGLRRQGSSENVPGLKDPTEIAKEISLALSRIDTPHRRETLRQSLEPLRLEPSFVRVGYDIDFLAEEDGWVDEFNRLSTGHKISLNIIVQLVGALQQNSLVLFDEPESHLHPPLLAALMKGIGTALEAHKSYGIVATHSPVVLQEISGCYARVLRRFGSQNSVEEPQIETFAENIGLLTRHVFNLDNSQSDYMGVIAELADGRSLKEIEALFARGLSSQARALIMQQQSRQQRDDN